jgi:hypothetical protein
MTKANLVIFWKESAAYIGIYAGVALLVCLLCTTVEWSRQTSSLSWPAISLKFLLLLVANIALFTLALLIMGWKGRLLGHEIITSIGLTLLCLGCSYAVQVLMNQRLGLGLHHPRIYASVSAVLLVAPFAIANAFVLLLGAGFKN